MAASHPEIGGLSRAPSPRVEGLSSSMMDSKPDQAYAKLLVSNPVTGTLIGKNGGTINAIRTQTGCNVKVSTSGSQGFYPGTSDRVVVLSGPLQSLEQAIVFILTALKDSPQHVSPEAVSAGITPLSAPKSSQTLHLRFVVPNSTVSLIIGKGGGRINHLRETTGAKIQISSRENTTRVESERIINVNGDFEHVRTSAILIAQIIQEDPTLRDFMHLSYPARPDSIQQTSPPRGPASPYAGYGLSSPDSAGYLVSPAGPHVPAASVLDIYSEIYLQIPDDFVGSLVGRNGQHLSDIRTTSGARVSISQRGELVPGTRDRLVTVTGPIRSVHAAHVLIMQRLAELTEQLQQRPDSLQH